MTITRKEFEIKVIVETSVVTFKHDNSRASIRYEDLKADGVRFTTGTINLSGNIVNGVKLSAEEVEMIVTEKNERTEAINAYLNSLKTIEYSFQTGRVISVPEQFRANGELFYDLARKFLSTKSKKNFRTISTTSEEIVEEIVEDNTIEVTVRDANKDDAKIIVENGVEMHLVSIAVEVEDVDYGKMLKREFKYVTKVETKSDRHIENAKQRYQVIINSQDWRITEIEFTGTNVEYTSKCRELELKTNGNIELDFAENIGMFKLEKCASLRKVKDSYCRGTVIPDTDSHKWCRYDEDDLIVVEWDSDEIDENMQIAVRYIVLSEAEFSHEHWITTDNWAETRMMLEEIKELK